jgi:uncharacterized membrane protein YhaH (DUF805 family)
LFQVWRGFALVAVFIVLIRRLPDTSRSGWWALIGLVPVVGTIIRLVFTVADSTAEENTHGPSPKVSPQTP